MHQLKERRVLDGGFNLKNKQSQSQHELSTERKRQVQVQGEQIQKLKQPTQDERCMLHWKRKKN